MINAIQFGDIRIGAYTFPDRKKPYIAIHNLNKNAIICVGQFNDEKSANMFMDTLAKYIGAKKEESRNG